jgi:hypothetical protein
VPTSSNALRGDDVSVIEAVVLRNAVTANGDDNTCALGTVNGSVRATSTSNAPGVHADESTNESLSSGITDGANIVSHPTHARLDSSARVLLLDGASVAVQDALTGRLSKIEEGVRLEASAQHGIGKRQSHSDVLQNVSYASEILCKSCFVSEIRLEQYKSEKSLELALEPKSEENEQEAKG